LHFSLCVLKSRFRRQFPPLFKMQFLAGYFKLIQMLISVQNIFPKLLTMFLKLIALKAYQYT
jgi:hypothetical protein